ncbi:TraB/GumN family protein [Niveibacterium sp. 24ML]|uniref:TraB/GumN family protein n=1 Tax=Niveibacterium sp. 24ML TaxID=2985512 RepID=UPI00226D58CD|nr:TraB/GumN family protein [Niveibacterium sp. 24ML]MCX9155199.1 TraB/GumN family protein [Niveibacterium sp. 24ML]
MSSMHTALVGVRHSSWAGRAVRVAAAFGLAACAQLALAAPLLLWEVTGGAAPVWLFGSVHVCRSDCYPIPPAVDARFKRADLLAVELDPTRAEVSSAMTGAGGESEALRSQLGPSDWKRLVRQVESMGLPEEMLAGLTAPMASVFVAMAVAGKSGLSPLLGVDLHFISRAQHDGKGLVELETVERQMQALGAGSPREQLDSLRASIRAAEDGTLKASLEEVVAAWRRGDAAGLSAAVTKAQAADPASRTMFKDLFDRRNREMADAIASLARGGRSVFVVVGSGHLAGAGSIPGLLAQRGFKVRQIDSRE